MTDETTLAGERLLHRLSTALAREARPDAVVQVALDALVSEVGARSAGVFLYDDSTRSVSPVYTVNYLPGMVEQIRGLSIESPALSNLALRSGEVQVIASINEVPDGVVFTKQLSDQIGVQAVAAVPLLIGGRTLGVLVYGLADEHQFDEAELRLLQEVGERISTAMERARLEQALARRADEAELLHSIALAAAGEDDINLILEAALAQLAGLLNFTGGSIALVEGDDLVIRAASGIFAGTALNQRLARGRGTTWRVLTTGTPFLSNDLPAEGLRTLSGDDEQTVRSYLVVPLIWRGTPFGVLEIDSIRPNAFRESDIGLMQRVATLLSGPIELARRYAAEVQLRRDLDQARGRLEAIIEHAPMGVSFFDANDQLVFANQAATETLRLDASRDSQDGRSWDDLIEQVLRWRWAGAPETMREIVNETQALREGILIHDFPLRSPEQMLLRIAAPVFESGRFSGHVILLIDVTSERQALMVSEQAIASRDRFISIASHELKTPLTSIKGTAQLLLRSHASGRLDIDRLGRQLRTIDVQAERLQDLIDDLLDISRIQSGRMELRLEPSDLAEIVDDLVGTLPDDRRQRVYLDAGQLVRGNWDPMRLEQVAQNLLDNALKYAPPETTVEVSVRTDGTDALLTVTDHGIGIPADELTSLFEPFSRAANAGQRDETGLGLGLYITRQIVERHGGTITVESVEGRGSTFTVRLPGVGHEA
ncbi:MAG TPA: GAF domain-containing protein [Thermomicrobiales bacterium]|nr:GAF domain-containing protein [Thermomicrobiales bacterium]